MSFHTETDKLRNLALPVSGGAGGDPETGCQTQGRHAAASDCGRERRERRRGRRASMLGPCGLAKYKKWRVILLDAPCFLFRLSCFSCFLSFFAPRSQAQVMPCPHCSQNKCKRKALAAPLISLVWHRRLGHGNRETLSDNRQS